MPILAHSHWRYQSQMMSDCFLLIHPPHPRPSAKLRGQHSLTQGCNPESHLLRKISSKETGCAGEMPWDSTRISNFKSPAQCVFNFLNASLNLFLMWMVVQRTIPTSSLRPPQPIMCIQGSPKLIAIRRSDKAIMLGKSSGPDSSSGIWTKTPESLNLHHIWVLRISQSFKTSGAHRTAWQGIERLWTFNIESKVLPSIWISQFLWLMRIRGSTPFKFSSGRKLQSGQ